MRFLMDENMPSLYRDRLMHILPDLIVQSVGGEGAPGLETPDPEILRWCEEHDFVLVTRNRKSMPGHLAAHLSEGRHVPGILVIRAKAQIGEVIEFLALIAVASREEEWRDVIQYIPPR